MRVWRQPLETGRIDESLCPRYALCPARPCARVRSRITGAHSGEGGNSSSARGPSSCNERVPQQLGPVVLAEPPREQLADRERIDRRPRLGRQTEAVDARAAACRAPPTSPRSRRPRSFRTPFGRLAACASTRARRPAEGRASETADRSRRSPRPAAPTAARMRPGDTAPSARGGRAPADSRPPAMRPARIRQRHEARRTGRTAPRPRRAGQGGGFVRLKGGRTDVSTTSRAPRATRRSTRKTALPLAAFEAVLLGLGVGGTVAAAFRSLQRLNSWRTPVD